MNDDSFDTFVTMKRKAPNNHRKAHVPQTIAVSSKHGEKSTVSLTAGGLYDHNHERMKTEIQTFPNLVIQLHPQQRHEASTNPERVGTAKVVQGLACHADFQD